MAELNVVEDGGVVQVSITESPPYITDNEIRDQLVSRARLYCDITGTKPSVFGKSAVKDPAFLSRLVTGKANPTLRTIQRAHVWLDDNWPKQPSPEAERFIVECANATIDQMMANLPAERRTEIDKRTAELISEEAQRHLAAPAQQ